MNWLESLALIVVLLFVTARFAPRAWKVIAIFIQVAIFLGACCVALAGAALFMNDETIFEAPGVAARTERFLTVNWAATSKDGLGSAACSMDQPAGKETKGLANRKKAANAVKSSGSATAPAAQRPGQQPSAEAAEEEDYYPELQTRGYPGIPRAKLFQMAVSAVKSLAGWTILKSDEHAGSLDCLYTSQIFGWQDDVRVRITPKNEIELCSRSTIGERGSSSILRWFPGDFGANIGHIKQFYAAIQPLADAFYAREESRQQNGY